MGVTPGGGTGRSYPPAPGSGSGSTSPAVAAATCACTFRGSGVVPSADGPGGGVTVACAVPSLTAWRSAGHGPGLDVERDDDRRGVRHRLTTPAILSAVRSCSSLPSSGEKLRLGKIAVTCVPELPPRG